MGRRAKPAKVKAEAKRPLARKALNQEAPGIHELEKRLAEALEQQTATAEILRVISSSPTDVQPVLEAVAENATRVCEAGDGVVLLIDGGAFRVAAHYGTISALARDEAIPISRGTVPGRAILERAPVHVPDLLAAGDDFPEGRVLGARFGNRTTLATPLLREGTPIGALLIRRTDVRPFSDKQIKLLQTFADQAVIAIENVRLFNETKEALEQQTATAEILKVISSSPTDIQPVLDAVAESAARFCGANDVVIRRVDGDVLRVAAHFGSMPVLEKTIAITRGTVGGRASLERRTIHVHDIGDAHAQAEYPENPTVSRGTNYRTILVAPLLREDMTIGVIGMRRAELHPFSDKQIRLLETFAAQAVIAIENVRLFNETKEALEQQTATADILRVISSSPTDLQPVFDTILGNAMRLCEAHRGTLRVFEGDSSRLVAEQGVPAAFSEWRRKRVEAPGPSSALGELVATKNVVHIPDLAAWRGYAEGEPVTVASVELGGTRTFLSVPMLKDGTLTGAIVLHRPEVRPFTDKQIALLKTFADQAVIAIENVRLFKELQARNAEITESLEQQTATAEILKVISSSPTDIQPVLDAVAESAARFCGASDVVIRQVDGDVLRAAAHFGSMPVRAETVAISRGTISGRATLERRTIHVYDILVEHARGEYPEDPSLARGATFRTMLIAPLLREDTTIGVISMRRPEVRPFSDKQIKLLETFAAQAVIAIENVRLFNETKEALERQTATAEILKVISSSPTDVQPVLDTVAERSNLLCRAEGCRVWLARGGQLHPMASYGTVYGSDSQAEVLPLRTTSPVGRAFLERRCVHVEDIVPLVETEYPDTREIQARYGFRTVLTVPMLRKGESVGVIALLRFQMRPFTPAEISLLQTFANQAVIAIENVRLFKELQARNAEVTEALEQQTATADILRVISSSPTDVQPVFDAIAESAARLYGASDVVIRRVDGDVMRVVAHVGSVPLHAAAVAPAISRDSAGGRAILERRTIHVHDVLESSVQAEYPDTFSMGQAGGFRTMLIAPLLREDTAIGTIVIRRPEVQPFSDKQVKLLETFAAQAVIAIENVRLFNETKEALEQQTATAEILKVISSSPTDTQPVFDAIVKTGLHLFGGSNVSLRLVKGDQAEMVASTLPIPDAGDTVINDERVPSSRSILRREVVHVPDIHATDWVGEGTKRRAESRGTRALVVAPMLRENYAIGTIIVNRATPGPFTDKQVALLKTFADQAVIAIENVRLFKELQTRNAEVTESLEQQTATAEILKVISSSPTDIQPVFDAILENATRLCGAHMGILGLYDGKTYRRVAQRGGSAEFAKWLAEEGPKYPPDTHGMVKQMITERRPIHILDRREQRAYRDRNPSTVALVELGGARSSLVVPMLKEGRVVGGIVIYRPEVRPFTQKQIDLVSTFANQAVIAIENVRLFKELQARNAEITEALEQQTATADILRVISSSPTDLQPVFDTILEHATRLCDAHLGLLGLYDGERYQTVAQRGGNADFANWVIARGPYEPDTGGGLARMITERRPIHIPDLRESPSYRNRSPNAVQLVEVAGARTYISVPMLKDDRVVGGITIYRPEVRPFTQKQIDLVSTFANQAVIAIENVRLFNETKEALEQQTVTAEILSVISSSPTDTQPVFDAIVKSGGHLFRGMNVSLRVVKGEYAVRVASTSPIDDPGGDTYPANDEHFPGARAMLRREVVQVPDIVAEEWVSAQVKQTAERRGWRAALAAPMVRENDSIGVIAVTRAISGPFTNKEIALLKTFADQAVIAIENVRLFNETKEALEQQTATAEILRVISSSPTDVQPVFDAIVKSGVHLFGGMNVSLRVVKGDRIELVASTLPPADSISNPLSDDRHVTSRTILRREVVHIPDVIAEDWVSERSKERAKQRGYRAIVSAPMLREGNAIGAIAVTRATPGLFTEKQVALLKTFADQAVIAIENVRLFNETKEALQQQTVISEILRVISSSPTDTQPVFDAIVKSGVHLFDGLGVGLRLVKGDQTELVASTRPLLDADDRLPLPLDDDRIVSSRAIVRREVVQVPDCAEDSIDERIKQRAERRGYRAILSAPMLRENNAIGAISVIRTAPGAFTEKQIALLKTFADQAVIAIENVRLFKELQARNADITESLNQQTATAEVLKVISRSTFDLKPVLETLVENAQRLCDATMGLFFRFDGEALRLEIAHNANPDYVAYRRQHPIPINQDTITGRAALERRPVHVHDILADPDYKGPMAAKAAGQRTVLCMPVLREGSPVGVINVFRTEVKPFTDKQVALLQTFADQAAIAIENVRLFQEIQDKSRQLEVASRHKSQFLANMSHELRTPLNAILGYTELILDGIYGDVSEKVHDVMGRVDKSGRHLLGLINDVLDLSKIEAGQLTLSLADYSLADVVQTVFTSVGSLAAEKKLALKVALASDLPRGRGDDRRLTQVLLNLVGNAIKFTEAGEVRLEARCSDGAFVVSVADTGPGISEADQQRIFEEFQQVDDSATRKKGGTGLGLSIAKRIIELHGGRIQVESAPGRGSTFTVTLPVRVERQAGTL